VKVFGIFFALVFSFTLSLLAEVQCVFNYFLKDSKNYNYVLSSSYTYISGLSKEFSSNEKELSYDFSLGPFLINIIESNAVVVKVANLEKDNKLICYKKMAFNGAYGVMLNTPLLYKDQSGLKVLCKIK
jgi:hypothetical protein